MSTDILDRPTDAQLRLLSRLARERDYPIDKIDVPSLTGGRDGTATAAISMLLALPKVRRVYVGSIPTPEPGWYRYFDATGRDRIVRVFISKKRPQAWYVKEPREGGKWSYLGQCPEVATAERITEGQASWYLGREVA